MVKKNKIPDGWQDYTDIGERVPGTPFLPFKVPLKTEVCQKKLEDESEWFTPEILLQKEPNIKLIIDLTMAQKDRYYFRKDFTTKGVWIEAVQCKGGGKKVPARHLVQKFHDIVDEFLTSPDASDNDAVIGVHCTHGLNRTGYFICKYMVERMNVNPAQAIKNFEIARGHKFRREVYVDDLLRNNFKRNWSSRSRSERHHVKTTWNSNDYTGNYFSSTQNDGGGPSRKRKLKN